MGNVGKRDTKPTQPDSESESGEGLKILARIISRYLEKEAGSKNNPINPDELSSMSKNVGWKDNDVR